MPISPDELFAVLERLEVAYDKHDHPPLFTVEDSRELRGQIPGAHCKSLFLRDRKHRFYLVVCLEHRRLDMKRLAARIDADRLSFARSEQLFEILGVRPGAVTPLALWNDREAHRVSVVLDSAMMKEERLNYHPLHNEATLTIGREGFERFLDACGHRLQLVGLDERAAAEKGSTT